MENDTQGEAAAGAQDADAMPHGHAVGAAFAGYRTLVDREDHALTARQFHHRGARLHAWALLGEHELAAAEIACRVAEQEGRLQREDLVAVEVAVQAVV